MIPGLSRLESGYGIKSGIADLKFNSASIASGITGFIFSMTGIVVIFSRVGIEAGLTQEQIISWIFGGFFIGGICSIFVSLYYKIPIVIGCSLSAVVLVGIQYQTFTVPEMCGAFIMSGLLIFLVGISGVMSSIKKILPIPVVMGMIVGVFMKYALRMIGAVQVMPLACGIILLAYFIAYRFFPHIPAQLIAVVAAALLLLFFPVFRNNTPEEIHLSFALPVFVKPSFRPNVFFSVSVPLAFIVITDAIKGYGILKIRGYEPPINSILSLAGIASIIGGFTITHVIGFADSGTAIVSGDNTGPLHQRYSASLVKNGFVILIALMLGFSYPLINAIPGKISDILAGLALLTIFTNSAIGAFGSRTFSFGAFTAMAVGISDISIKNISAPILALAAGLLVSVFMEWDDFKALSPGGFSGCGQNPGPSASGPPKGS